MLIPNRIGTSPPRTCLRCQGGPYHPFAADCAHAYTLTELAPAPLIELLRAETYGLVEDVYLASHAGAPPYTVHPSEEGARELFARLWLRLRDFAERHGRPIALGPMPVAPIARLATPSAADTRVPRFRIALETGTRAAHASPRRSRLTTDDEISRFLSLPPPPCVVLAPAEPADRAEPTDRMRVRQPDDSIVCVCGGCDRVVDNDVCGQCGASRIKHAYPAAASASLTHRFVPKGCAC